MFGTWGFVILSLAFLAVICLSIYLCKYRLIFISIAIIGLALFSISLYFEMVAVINSFENTNGWIVDLVLEFALPILFFILTSIVIVRWGIKRNSSGATRFPRETLTHYRSSTTRWLEVGRWFTRKENLTVCLIAAFILAIHVIYIDNPPAYMADERVYISDANRILSGRPMVYLEHPPLGKWLIAGGIFLFGNNSVGWRIFPIIFSTASIFMLYFICHTLMKRRSLTDSTSVVNDSEKGSDGWLRPSVFIPVLATFLFATENLSFVQGQLAMLDVFSVTLMLSGFLTYLNKRFVLCGLFLGLGILCKETAFFGLLAILLHWVIARRHEISRELKSMWCRLRFGTMINNQTSDILGISKTLAVSLITWLVLVPLLEYTHPTATGDPLLRIYYIYWHSTMFLAGQAQPGVGILTSPWQWLVRPEWQNYNYSHSPAYLSTIGYTVWALIIPSIIYLGFKLIKFWKNNTDIIIFPLCWFFSVYVPFVIIELISERPMFSFYFYPAVPAVCIAIALLFSDIHQKAKNKTGTSIGFNSALAVFLIGTLVSFIILSPIGNSLLNIASWNLGHFTLL